MDIEINWMIYAAQIRDVMVGTGPIFVVVSLAFAGVCFFITLNEYSKADDPDIKLLKNKNRRASRVAIFFAALTFAVALIPSRGTIFYSAAIQYGPEAVERMDERLGEVMERMGR